MRFKSSFFIALFAMLFNTSFAQLFSNETVDTLFPVINKLNQSYDTNSYGWTGGAAVTKSLISNGKYYLIGNFTNLSKNHGSALVIDTATKEIKTAQRWRVNGTVVSSVSDGKGGFYIAGSFTNIGDSIRKNLAQIDRFGKPTAWRLDVDRLVNQIAIRNDTLYLAGSFYNVGQKPRTHFALYSLTGDTVIATKPLIANFQYLNSFLLDKDTLIFAGRRFSQTTPLLKYSIKGDSVYSWRLKYIDYADINQLQFSKDSSVILYGAEYNGTFVTAVNKITGLKMYDVSPNRNLPTGGSNGTGSILGLKVVGDKAYMVGDFSTILKNGYYVAPRNGFAVFDVNTGTLLNESLKTTGHLSFLEVLNGKLYISGKFTSVNGVDRENFAVLDTGSYAIDPLQLAPTDQISSLTYSGGSLFVSGFFNGLYSIKRNGFAVIDSATGAILPSGLKNSFFSEIKKMVVKGDTLFILGILNRPNLNCRPNDYNSALKMYRISTGAQLTLPINLSYDYNSIHNFELNENFIYISWSRYLLRYNISTFQRDANFAYSWYGENVTDFKIGPDTIYAIADTRFNEDCTSFYPNYASYHKISKTTGNNLFTMKYEPANPTYDQPVFEQAILVGTKMYIQGIFKKLNGISRTDYFCINTVDGSITDWHPTFVDSNTTKNYSPLQKFVLYNNKIWITGSSYDTLSNGQNFSGFGTIDPTTAALDQSLIVDQYLPRQFDIYVALFNYIRSKTPYDFIFGNNTFLLVGDFDFVNGSQNTGMIRYYTNNTLPLKLLSFYAEKIGNVVQLEWNTTNEKNTFTFEVERKTQGTFNTIGKIKAMDNTGNETANYKFIDDQPGVGPNYYRLKNIDKDGNYIYSSAKLVVFKKSVEVAIYPNPALNKITVDGLIMKIRLMDNIGKVVKSKEVKDQTSHQTTIDTSTLQRGFYFIECTLMSGETIVQKVLIN